MDWLSVLVHDARFWTAVIFLIQTVLFFALPDFPKPIWEALSAVLVLIFGALTAKNASREVRQLRALRDK